MLSERVLEMTEKMGQMVKNMEELIRQENVKKPDIRNNAKTKTFDNFIAGENNMEVKEAARKFSEGEEGVLYIYGPKGNGTSHLVQAIVNEKCKAVDREKIEITTAEMFINRSIEALAKLSTRELWNDYHQFQVIVFEDFDDVEGKSVMIEELLKLLNSLAKSGKTVILTGSKPLAEHFTSALPVISFDFPCTVLKLEPAEKKARQEILKNAVKDVQSGSVYASLKYMLSEDAELDADCPIKISPEVLNLIEENVTGSVGEMLKALERVVKFSALMDKNVDEDFVRKVLEEYFK